MGLMSNEFQRLQAGRRLQFECLEPRRALSITVNTLVDENNGLGAGAGTSLREAIAAAASGETINFSVTGTINLVIGPSAADKHLLINKSLTISGPGQNLLTIKAFDPTPGLWNADGSSVLLIDDGNSLIDRNVMISGVTLTGGDVTLYGGGIQSRENLTLVASTVSGNFSANIGGGIWEYEANLNLVSSTITGNGARVGGGVEVRYGDLSISSSTIQANKATHGSVSFATNIIGCVGGGIFFDSGNLTITGSTIADNDADGDGGGIVVGSANASIVASTISGNRALGDDLNGTIPIYGGNAGGILVGNTTLSIRETTISGNSARLAGGGVSLRYSALTASRSTITGNRADANGAGGGTVGGGVNVPADGSSATLDGTIVAGNLRGSSTRDDIAGAATARYSLIGDNTGATITSVVGNLIGTSAAPIDALLAPLANNGGPTWTHALLGGSLAIDRGDPTVASGIDQRGSPYVRVFDGDGVSSARADIGALEAQPKQPRGDYNRSGVVDAADYVLWRKTSSTNGLVAFSGADGSGNGGVGAEDYSVWREHFGQTTAAAASGASGEALDASVDVVINALTVNESSVGQSSLQPSSTMFAITLGERPGALGAVFDDKRAKILTSASPSELRVVADDALVAWVASLGQEVDTPEVVSFVDDNGAFRESSMELPGDEPGGDGLGEFDVKF